MLCGVNITSSLPPGFSKRKNPECTKVCLWLKCYELRWRPDGGCKRHASWRSAWPFQCPVRWGLDWSGVWTGSHNDPRGKSVCVCVCVCVCVWYPLHIQGGKNQQSASSDYVVSVVSVELSWHLPSSASSGYISYCTAIFFFVKMVLSSLEAFFKIKLQNLPLSISLKNSGEIP